MMKRLNSILITTIVAIVAILMGLYGMLTNSTPTTYAESVNGITFESGATFRANQDSLGIRFKATIDLATSITLFNYDEGVPVSYKNTNYKVGMIIAPVNAFSIPKTNSYYTSKDYLSYLTDAVNGLGRTKADIAVDFSFENNNFGYNSDGSVSVKGALVELQNGNLNNNYKAIVYYTLDGTNYMYSGFSDQALLADLADNVLSSNDLSEVDPDVLEDIYGIVANTVAMRETGSVATYNSFYHSYTVNVSDYELMLNRDININSIVKGLDVDYSLTNKTGGVTLANDILKATGVCSGTLNLSSYDGKIRYTFDLINEPILSIITQGDTEAVTDYKVVCPITSSTPNVTNSNGKKLVGFINQALYTYKGWGHGTNYTSPYGGVNTYYEVDIFKRVTSQPTSYKSTDKYIVIGNCSYSRLAGLDDYEGETETDYKITVKDNSVFVQGNISSLRFAVYGLLNKMIGYERISLNTTGLAGEVKVNDKNEVVLGKSEIECEVKNDIPYNFGFSSGAIYSQDYGAAVDRSASLGYAFTGEMGDGSNYNDDGSGSHTYSIRGIHNALGYFPYATYSTTHPEWYSQKSDGNGGYTINTTSREDGLGTRTEATQLCYYGLYYSTDDEAVDIVMNVIKRYNNTNAISFSNMDNGGFCKCEHCKLNNYSTGGDACYWYLKFMNKIAKAMQEDEDTDHMKLKILIYGNIINQPPLDSNNNPNITLEDNIMIEFAYNYGDFYAGMSSVDRALLDNWSKFTTKSGLLFWLYCTKTSYGMFFFDDFTNMQSKYQYLYSIGAQYIEDEGNKSAAAYTNFSNLRVYLESKVTANVNCDYEALTDNFFDSYFGQASSKMRDIFEKQKTLQQTAYANWTGENGLWHQGYDLIPSKVASSSTKNSTGNNLLGTYSSNTFHYYVGNSFHGNRYLLSLIQPKAEIEYMLKKVKTAISTIAVSNLTTARKEELVSRILLEEIALIYQYCFIYDDNFATGNDSYQAAQGTTKAASPQVLSQSDLQNYLGCDSMAEVKAMFYQLAKHFGFNAINYKALTSGTKSIYTTWDLENNSDANIENSTWYAQYMSELLNPTQYTITYVLNGGVNDSDNPVAYVANTEEITLNNPTREYYTFAGWTEGNKILEGSTGNKTFTATWTPVQYSISYLLNGGVNNANNPDTYNVESGLITLKSPTKAGYIFLGWSDNGVISAGSHGDKEFTAIWSTNKDINGIEYVVVGNEYQVKGIGTFTGVNVVIPEKLGGVKVTSIGASAFANTSIENITLSANITSIGDNAFNNSALTTILYNGDWSDVQKGVNWGGGKTIKVLYQIGKEDGKINDGFEWDWEYYLHPYFRITYILNGGVNNESNPTKYNSEDSITLLNPTKSGYSFEGWQEGDTIAYGSTGNKTFTAIWGEVLSNVSYELNGGENNANNPATYSEAITSDIILQDPTKAGYTFTGWTEGDRISVGSTGDKTFTANWTITNYTITYVLDGGENNANNPATYTINDEITLLNPTKSGNIFVNWQEGSTIAEGTTGNKTFTAIWDSLEKTINTEVARDLKDGINISSLLSEVSLQADASITSATLGSTALTITDGAVSFGAVADMTNATKMMARESAYTLTLQGTTYTYVFTNFKLYSILVSNADEYDTAYQYQTSEGYKANGGKEYWAVIGFDADVKLNTLTSTTILGPSTSGVYHGFTGVIDGRGHKVSGVTQSTTLSGKGLASTGSGATLKNIELTYSSNHMYGIFGRYSRGIKLIDVTINTSVSTFSGGGFLYYDFSGSADMILKNVTIISSSESAAIANCEKVWFGTPYTNKALPFTGQFVVDNVNLISSGNRPMKLISGLSFTYGTEHAAGYGDAIVLADGATKGITIYTSKANYLADTNGVEVTSEVVETPINATVGTALTVNTLIGAGKAFLYAITTKDTASGPSNVNTNGSTITYTTEGTYKLLVVSTDYINYIYTVNVTLDD